MMQFDSEIVVEMLGMKGCVVVYTTQSADVETVGSTVSHATFLSCALSCTSKTRIHASEDKKATIGKAEAVTAKLGGMKLKEVAIKIQESVAEALSS
jgi:hypothetical protein